MGEFEKTLVPARGEALERGDYVYETVRFGKGPNDVKYKKLRVLKTDRGTATVVPAEGPSGHLNEKKIRLSDLKMEKPDAPSSLPSPSPAADAAADRIGEQFRARILAKQPGEPDSQFAAWLEMGRGLLGDVDAEESALREERAAVELRLHEIDTRYKGYIEKAENELAVIRKNHADDRALAESLRETVMMKLLRVVDRRNGLKKMLDTAKP